MLPDAAGKDKRNEKPPLIVRWEKITGKLLAKAIFEAVAGDCESLKAKPEDKNGPWDRIAQRLGSRFNSQSDRLFSYISYHANKDSAKDSYVRLCLHHNITLFGSTDRPDFDGLPTYCICRLPTIDEKPDFNMVKCKKCKIWFHCPCLKISAEEFKDPENYTCSSCHGSRRSMFVPRLWRPSLEREIYVAESNAPSESNQSQAETQKEQDNSELKPAPSSSLKSPVGKSTSVSSSSNNSSGESQTPGCDSVNDNGESETIEDMFGPVELEKEILVSLTADEWKQLIPQKNKKKVTEQRYLYRLPEDIWTHRFISYFMRSSEADTIMKGCVINFTNHQISKGPKAKNYLHAKASCGRKKEGCMMQYDFLINKEPRPSTEVVITVRARGKLQHDPTQTKARKFAGIARKEGKVLLRNEKGCKVHRERMTNSEGYRDQLDRGNTTNVPSKNVLRVARNEVLAEGDKDKDIFQDLRLRKEEMNALLHLQGRVVKGFIQDLYHTPFVASMYTEQQVEILSRLLKRNPNTTIHLDSTGGMTSELSSDMAKTRPYYYVGVVMFPGAESVPCFPILEFILNKHDKTTIAFVLQSFFNRLAEFSNKKVRGYGIRRVETDYSQALIRGTLLGLNIGTLEDYLRTCFKALVLRKPIIFVHHICRSHASKFLKNQIKNKYADKPELHQKLKRWSRTFLVGIDLYDFNARLDEIILIAGKRYQTAEVTNAIETIGNRPNKSVPNQFMELRLDNVPDGNFIEEERLTLYVYSPFSHFAILRCHELQIPLLRPTYRNSGLTSVDENDNEDLTSSAGQLNPYFNIDFLEYLIHEIFPVACLLDHSLFALNGYSTSSDNNAPAESYNKMIKRDELDKKIPMRVGRLVDYLEKNVKGRTIEFSLALSRYERGLQGDRRKKDDNVNEPAFAPTTKDNEANTTPPRQASPAGSSDSGATEIIPKRENLKAENQHQSSDFAEEVWKPKKGTPVAIPIQDFTMPVLIPYGGTISWNGQPIDISNTCNIDNCLFLCYFLYTRYDSFNVFVNSLKEKGVHNATSLLETFQCLGNSDFEKAKQIVIFDMMNLNPKKLKTGNLFGSEERFLETLKHFCSIRQLYDCKENACPVVKSQRIYPFVDVSISDNDNGSFLPRFDKSILKECVGNCNGTNVKVSFEWWKGSAPPFLVFSIAQANVGDGFAESDIPPTKSYLGKKYKLVAYTVHENSPPHFYAVVVLGKSKRKYDDLNCQQLLDFSPARDGSSVSTVWYIETKM